MLEPGDVIHGDGRDEQQLALVLPKHRNVPIRHVLDHWHVERQRTGSVAQLDFQPGGEWRGHLRNSNWRRWGLRDGHPCECRCRR